MKGSGGWCRETKQEAAMCISMGTHHAALLIIILTKAQRQV